MTTKTPEFSSVQIQLFVAMLDKALRLIGYKIVPLTDEAPPKETEPPVPKRKASPIKSVKPFLKS